MICVKCNREIGDAPKAKVFGTGINYIHYSCPSEAEHSGVLQGCPPSVNCSAGAGADAQPDSPIGSVVPRGRVPKYPHRTGMRCEIRGVLTRTSLMLKANKLDAEGYPYVLCEFQRHLEQLGERFYSGDVSVVDEFLQLYNLDDSRQDTLDAHPAAGERALARNADISDRAGKGGRA